MLLQDQIKSLASEYHPQIIACRRHLHQNPELSFEESETAAFMKQQLKDAGISISQENVAGNGFVARIEGKDPASSLKVFRAELDALPIQEQSDAEYKSQKEGVMHACGHDVHMSCVFGAAKILHELRNEWSGTIKLIYQPAEEKLPGGASLLIAEGVLDDPKPDAVIALHVMPEMRTGKVGFKSGQYMASTDEIYITISGQGGHAALVDQRTDTVLIASKLRVELDKITEQSEEPSVIAFGKIIAEGATNVIPSEVFMEGTFRTMNEEWRSKAHKLITEITEKITADMGATCELEIKKGYPSLVNDKVLTDLYKRSAVDYLDESAVEELPLRMTADDFAFYSQVAPSCYFRLGVGNDNIDRPIHHPSFDADEKALELGAGLLAWLAAQDLNSK